MPPGSPPASNTRRARRALRRRPGRAVELFVERISGRADRANGVFFTGPGECPAEAPDMDIDGAGFNINVGPPDGVEQLLAAEDAAGMLDQMLEQAVFGGARPPRRTRCATRSITISPKVTTSSVSAGRMRRRTARMRASNSVIENGLVT